MTRRDGFRLLEPLPTRGIRPCVRLPRGSLGCLIRTTSSGWDREAILKVCSFHRKGFLVNKNTGHETVGDAGNAAPAGNVYRMPRRSERTARRRSPLAHVTRVKEPVTQLCRPVPLPTPKQSALPIVETRDEPVGDAEFFILVQPQNCGLPWRIGRIPVTADPVRDKIELKKALDLGWLFVCERTWNDESKPMLDPIRFSGALSSRDMICQAKEHCDILASVIGYDASKIKDKLEAATVLMKRNILDKD